MIKSLWSLVMNTECVAYCDVEGVFTKFRDYLHKPSSWVGRGTSLLADNDRHVVCSAQACFLPMPKEGEAKFNVVIHNRESSPGEPAILAIVASANGTSAEIVERRQGLYHNKNGEKASFIGQRLSDHRREMGSELSFDEPMTTSEKQQNMLLIIQVPLLLDPMRFSDLPTCSLKAIPKGSEIPIDVESAIITVGAGEGPHLEVHNLRIERDPKFPIRVTMQYYKATSNGTVNDEVMKQISEELQGARKWAVAISSLVTETTDRTTEHKGRS